MQAKIKSNDVYDSMHEDSNSLGLIKVIKGIAYKFESQHNIYLAIDNAKCAFYAYHQGPEETNANYMSKFKNTIKVIKNYGQNIGEDIALVIEELKSAGLDVDKVPKKEVKKATEVTKRKTHAITFLKRADKGGTTS